MDELQIFNNDEFGDVRTIVKGNEIWFVAKDLSDVLNYRDAYTATRGLDDNEKMLHTMCVGGQKREITLISEPGLYSLVLRSRKEEAKKFKRWITHEIIPSIRKHGMYATKDTIDKILENPDFGIQLLTKLKQEKEARKILEFEN
ncbi:MAG: Bro-N domain-containing protein [Halanaerobiales bacterium]